MHSFMAGVICGTIGANIAFMWMYRNIKEEPVVLEEGYYE